jgi:hypothetical protein
MGAVIYFAWVDSRSVLYDRNIAESLSTHRQFFWVAAFGH